MLPGLFATMIYIALDSSILHKEGLGSKHMRLLTRLALADELAISIPEMVAREFVSKCVADAQDKLNAAHVQLAELRRKLGKAEAVADELASVSAETVRIRDSLAATIHREFEAWLGASKVTLLKFNPTDIDAVLDGYFNGTGPYKRPKSREDIPDAIISSCILALAKTQRPLHVAVGDGKFNQYLNTVGGLRIYKELAEFFQSAEVSGVVSRLDHAQGTAAFREFLLSDRFSFRMHELLSHSDGVFDDVYVGDEGILNPDALEVPSAFGLKIDGAGPIDLHAVKCIEATKIAQGQFVLEIELRTTVWMSFCASYGDLLALPDVRQREIEQDSMDGDGICDLREVKEALLRGQLFMEFDSELDVAALEAKIMHPDFELQKVAFGVDTELSIDTAEIMPSQDRG